jgi:hypothetical protein
MLSDSRGASLRIDNHILDDRERLERVTEMRHDDQMASAEDFSVDLGDQDRMMTVARESVEGRRESRSGNPQAQVSLQVKLVVKLLQSGEIGFAGAADKYRRSIVSGI